MQVVAHFDYMLLENDRCHAKFHYEFFNENCVKESSHLAPIKMSNFVEVEVEEVPLHKKTVFFYSIKANQTFNFLTEIQVQYKFSCLI